MTDTPRPSRRDVVAAGTTLAGLALAAPAAAQPGAQPAAGPDTPPDLAGTSILITGCSSGFGRLGAEHYARAGATVFATMRDMPRPEAEALAALAADDDLDIRVIEIDVRSDESVARGTGEALEAAGGAIDVLINNAGIAISGPVELQDAAAMQEMFETNVAGCQRLARALLPGMRAKGRGYVINVSSQLGRVILPGLGAYSGTKFALEAMSEQMAYELAAQGIDVTVVQPGGYPTAIWENGNRYTQALLDRTPDARKAAYPALVGAMGERSPTLDTDPMDVPRAIAALIASPNGSRPLRMPVHPGPKPQAGINEASRQAQIAWLGESPLGPAIRKVNQ